MNMDIETQTAYRVLLDFGDWNSFLLGRWEKTLKHWTENALHTSKTFFGEKYFVLPRTKKDDIMKPTSVIMPRPADDVHDDNMAIALYEL